MSRTTKSSPGRPRSVEANRAILQATLELLAEVGYQGLSIEAIAARAGVGKTTIYRRYDSKEELLVEAIEHDRPELKIPNTGSFWADIDIMHRQCAEIDFSPLGRQTLAMIISLASTNPKFADIYRQKYLLPRVKAASEIFDRAKARGELAADVDTNLIFDLMLGLLYKLVIFEPETDSIEKYMRRALEFILNSVVKVNSPMSRDTAS
mgnify:CR=1 FL=1